MRELKQVREENAGLKRIVADLTLDKAMLQDGLSKKVLKSSQRGPLIQHWCEKYGVSERRVRRVGRMSRRTS